MADETYQEPWERGERISKRQWYTTMYSLGFQEVWNKKAGKKDYVRSLVTKALMSGMDKPDEILTLVRAWGKKHKVEIDEDDLLNNIIPEQDEFTYSRRAKWRHDRLVERVRRDQDKLCFRIQEFVLAKGVTSRKALADALGEKDNTIKKQLERLIENNQLIKAGYGKYGMSDFQQRAFQRLVDIKNAPHPEVKVIINVSHAVRGIFDYYYGPDAKRMYGLWEKLKRLGETKFLNEHPDYEYVVSEEEYCDNTGVTPFAQRERAA